MWIEVHEVRVNMTSGRHQTQRIEYMILAVGIFDNGVVTYPKITPSAWLDRISSQGVSGDEYMLFERFISAAIKR